MMTIAAGISGVGGLFGLSLLAKATVVLLLSLVAVRFARRRAASVRHLLLAAGFAALMALPIVAAFGPTVRIEIPLMPTVARTPVGEGAVTDSAPRGGTAAATGLGRSMARSSSVTAAEIVTAVWAVGVVVCTVPIVVGLIQVRRLRRTGLPWPAGQTLIESLARETGFRGHADALIHESVAAPVTCGVKRHAILFPIDASTWPDDALRRAAIHELEHVRRADCFVNAITRAICALYWFHPLVWVASRRLGLEAERACDDAVVTRAEATGYAEQLVALAGQLSGSTRHPLLGMASRSDLVSRVTAVLDPQQARGRVSARAAAAVTVAACVLVVGMFPLQAVSVRHLDGRDPERASQSATVSAVLSVVKPNRSGGPRSRLGIPERGRFVATNVTVQELISATYGGLFPLRDDQIVGGPSWVRSERFDVEAKLDVDAPAEPDGFFEPTGDAGVANAFALVRVVLEERFGLVARGGARDGPIYLLTLARRDRRLGPRLQVSEIDCEAVARAGPYAALAGPDGTPLIPCGVRARPGYIEGSGATMMQLARQLARAPGLQREVVEVTELPGRYDFGLTYAPVPPPGDAGRDGLVESGPSLFTALQEQLGLKLESRRGRIPILIIEKITRPTPN